MQLINTTPLRGTSSLNPKSLAQVLDQWFSTFTEAGPTFVFKNISGPTRTTTCQKYLFFLSHYIAYYHGRRKDFFQRRATRGFFQNFSEGGRKVAKIFFPLETRKTTFFCWNFKNAGAGLPCPPYRRATPMLAV